MKEFRQYYLEDNSFLQSDNINKGHNKNIQDNIPPNNIIIIEEYLKDEYQFSD